MHELAKTIGTHLDGIPACTPVRVTNGALHRINNAQGAQSSAFCSSTTWLFIDNICHRCAGLPPP
jgi:hypothetical protein